MQNQKERVINSSKLPRSMLIKSNFSTGNLFQAGNETGNSAEVPDLRQHTVKLELVNNKKNELIDEIRKIIIDFVYYSEKQIKIKFSDYLSQTIHYHYTYMANLFSKIHGSSIQHFIIATKIERVKELLIYEALSLTEISFKLHYSSVAHLSKQFKKVTGLSPSSYLASIAQNAGLRPQISENVFSNYSNKVSVILTLVPPPARKKYEGYSRRN